MLVRVQNAAGTLAERALIDWLRTWKNPGDPHGVATVNCSLFHNDRLHQFDAVIWTPTSCVVVEAEALAAKASGELEVPLSGPWRVGNQAVALEGGDRRTPVDKSHEHTYALQSWLSERGLGQRVVHGAVLVVPPHGSDLRIRQLWNDPSFEVVLGDDPRRFADYLKTLASQGRAQWTTTDIAMTFRGLGILPYLPAPQDLEREGFGGPVDITLWYGGPQQAQAETYLEEKAQAEQEYAGPLPITMPWYSPWKLYPKEAERVDMGRALLRIALAMGMVIAVAWVIWFVFQLLTYSPG
ncbi:nuclease-related domain-containing protein [Nocardia sp. BMG51109]|uniref:nuclease-related domain-containing protein n=1 Tax=Nocardia sp. BMG51109 TaxID=1056816 RepID=UPI00046512DB|nr:nuclease-related domain-containing protein [Nocardia sp. BMG51109]